MHGLNERIFTSEGIGSAIRSAPGPFSIAAFLSVTRRADRNAITSDVLRDLYEACACTAALSYSFVTPHADGSGEIQRNLLRIQDLDIIS